VGGEGDFLETSDSPRLFELQSPRSVRNLTDERDGTLLQPSALVTHAFVLLSEVLRWLGEPNNFLGRLGRLMRRMPLFRACAEHGKPGHRTNRTRPFRTPGALFQNGARAVDFIDLDSAWEETRQARSAGKAQVR